jgi:hypothetical protein
LRIVSPAAAAGVLRIDEEADSTFARGAESAVFGHAIGFAECERCSAVDVVGVVGFRIIVSLVDDSTEVVSGRCCDTDAGKKLQAGVNLFFVGSLTVRMSGGEKGEECIGGAADGVADSTWVGAGADIGEVPAAIRALAFGQPFEGEADCGFASGRATVFGEKGFATGFSAV